MTSLLLVGGVIGAVGVSPAAAAPISVVSNDFENGSYEPWLQSGSPTLTVVDSEGGKALQIANRVADFDGVQTPLGALEVDTPYTLSMRVKLAAPAPAPVGVRFVSKSGYTWVGNTTMTADAWTTVTGTYTFPGDSAAANVQLYIGTADLTPAAPYSYLVDDLTITTEEPGPIEPDPGFVPGGAVNPTTTPVVAAQGTGNVSALTFDDGPNGATTAALLDFLGENDIAATFCVIGQNIEAPGGAALLRRMVAEGHTLCNHSTDYEDMGALTPAQVEEKLKANLEIIRTALGDPQAKVPFFRAPNGSWGQTQPVAVALGMQPLAVTNTITDWVDQDADVLIERLRAAMKPGELVLVHDGGGDREGTRQAVETVVAERLAAGWTFALPVGAPTAAPSGDAISTDFEDGLDGWIPRDSGSGAPTVAITTTEAHGGTQAALVSGRTSQGSGIAHDVTGLLTPGTPYSLTAWVKFAAGHPAGDVWLSFARTTAGATSYDTIAQFTGMSNGEWVEVQASFTPSAFETGLLYFETSYNAANTSDLLIDDIVVGTEEPAQVQDITPIKDTVDFPAGVAIDSRETTGPAAELVTRHFDQVTSENYMKPEAWYDENRAFRSNPEADALMQFAQQEDLNVYGHTLVWHSQTPAWFFQNDAGAPLTTSAADRQVLRDRMRDHIFNVAEYLSTTYGEFGSDTNPLYAFDVVNEVISDSGEFEDGMRRSEWYRILGEEFVDLAFEYANEAFNEEYAADGAERPVTLFINDYNTEQGGKQQRLRALVERLIERDVPVDGVGHQFHVSLSFPVTALEAALAAFDDLDLVQAVTELDVTIGTPVTERNLIEQGYYYRDAFRSFRAFSDSLFSVTVWGLRDGRSWRVDSGAPLVFDDALQAKPAYYGIVDGELPARQRAANVFAGDVALDADATSAVEWSQLPLNTIEETAGFQLRWAADHLTAYVTVEDATQDDTDGVEFVYGGQTYAFGRDGSGDVDGVVSEIAGGYSVVAHLPQETPLTEGAQLALDVRVVDGTDTIAWNTPGTLGTLTLLEPLSYVEVAQAAAAPAIDAEVDAAWSDAVTVTTGKQVEGTDGATAEVRTLWSGNTLYVLAEVADPVVDVSGSDPWIQDSVEFYVDPGNVKNGSYRYDDTQIRISATNVVSFGTGDEAFQQGRLQSATRAVDGGYVVEASISLLESGGLGSFQGMDFQVNDASGGARTSIRNWADPSGLSYQSTARWGVGQLVAAAVAGPTIELGADTVAPGGTVPVLLSGFEPDTEVDIVLGDATPAASVPAALALEAAALPQGIVLATVTIGTDGAATTQVTIPGDTVDGAYQIGAVVDGTVIAAADLQVVAADAGGAGGPGAGSDGGSAAGGLAFTGGEAMGILLLAMLLIAAGATITVRRRLALRS